MMANIPAASAANKTRFRIAAIAAGLLAAGLAGLHAQPITVPNFSFESQLAPNTSPFVNINIDSWQKIAEPSFYTPAFGSSGVPWVGTAGVFFDTNPYPNKDGNQLGYILAVPQVTLFQTLSATFQAGESYNVTLGVFGKPSVAPGSTLELSLYYLDNLNNEVTVGSTTITYSAGAFSVTNLVDFTASTAQIDPNSQAAGKNIGTTHITNGCYRLHPIEWNIGEVAGLLAAHCLNQNLTPHQVQADDTKLAGFQSRLTTEGIETRWPDVRGY